jgi:hypothetical protein
VVVEIHKIHGKILSVLLVNCLEGSLERRSFVADIESFMSLFLRHFTPQQRIFGFSNCGIQVCKESDASF